MNKLRSKFVLHTFMFVTLLALTFSAVGVTPVYAASIVVNSQWDGSLASLAFNGTCELREGMDGAFESWLLAYERESCNFSVCRFVEQIGVSAYGTTEAVRIHDEVTGAAIHLPLA